MYIQFLKEENRFYAFQEIMKSLKLKRHRIGIRYEEKRHRQDNGNHVCVLFYVCG